jgi:hypothetical protein
MTLRIDRNAKISRRWDRLMRLRKLDAPTWIIKSEQILICSALFDFHLDSARAEALRVRYEYPHAAGGALSRYNSDGSEK